MLQVALRGLMAHKSRLVTTFLAVSLGVAFVSGVLVLTDTVNRTFNDLFSDVYAETDAVVRSNEEIDQGFGGGEVRGLIDESLLDEVQDVDGVAEADVSIDGFARIIGPDGDPVGNPAMGAPTFGTNWQESEELNPFTISDGEPPSSDDEVVIDRGSAKDTGYQVGDTVEVQTRTGANEYTLSGIARFGSADNPGGASFAMWTVEEAQEQLGEPGKVSSISAAAEDGISQRELVSRIRDALGDDVGVEVITGQQITEETQDDIQQALGFLTIFLGFFGVIAVVVGAFVIYNAFSIIVAQRTREMALLRAVGARRRQVRRAVLVEAIVVGVAGSVFGFLLGLGVAFLLSSFLQLPDSSLAILPRSVLIALAVGIVVTLLSALIPAWRASRVPPLAAMRDVAVDTSARSRGRLIVGLVILVAAVALLVAGAFGSRPLYVGLGVLGLLIGAFLIGPVVARPVAGVLGAPVARLRGVSGELARDNAVRNPRRTALTAFALTIGVGLVTFFLVLNSSVRASIDEALSTGFNGDFIVTTDDFGLVGLPPQVGEDIAELPEVDQVVPFRFAPAFVGDDPATPEIEGDTTAVTGTNDGIFDLFELDVVEGRPSLASGEVVIDRDTATSDNLDVGDTVEIRFLDDARGGSPPPATVSGIYESGPAENIGSYVIGLDDYDAAITNPSDVQVLVSLADGVSVEEAQPAIREIVDKFPTADVESVDEFKDTISSQFDPILYLILVLLVLAVIIAFLGIANTIALSVLERTRELGLLRAVGMRRKQVRSAVRWESAIIALMGTVLGLTVGLLGGWGITRSLRDEGFEAFAVPVVLLVIIAVFAGLLGLMAALVPAYRAARMNVLSAIHTE
ncbi:MAG TPA: FtsX-like permease family protein [Acidimicrobiales bacterium]|nr:FtsX-like permease family protein [Acidimicrobiales bacterium]